jgi:hypothetical protein
MKVYRPDEMTEQESLAVAEQFRQQIDEMNVPDERLKEYTLALLESYRDTLGHFSSQITSRVPFYSEGPFHIRILRLGTNGVIWGCRPDHTQTIRIVRPQDFDPPLSTINLPEIQQDWQTPYMWFDFRIRDYDFEEARSDGVNRAIGDALDAFWQTLTPLVFRELCTELLQAEGVEIEQQESQAVPDLRYDALGTVSISEPARFRRFEQWAFELKHHQHDRFSVEELHELENRLKKDTDLDTLCLITSGDLTSLGNNIVVQNLRMRVWDRYVLNGLVHRHLEITQRYFPEYPSAIKNLSQETQELTTIAAKGIKEFYQDRLDDCPTGQRYFAEYEKLGIEIWEYVFSSALGKAKPQSRTLDGVQRRDVLFKNLRKVTFWQRVAERYGADFIILDFKNYKDPIESQVLFDVQKYANKALGRFIIIVSRAGAGKVSQAQIRIFRDDEVVILVVSDQQMLEMIERKERGENPEDLLDDILDHILISY